MLEARPFASTSHCFWNNEILTPIQKNGMIERADDLGLPYRTVIIRRDYFSPEGLGGANSDARPALAESTDTCSGLSRLLRVHDNYSVHTSISSRLPTPAHMVQAQM
ncbi:hypothetical protein C8Q74DRAFT_1374125 [Fomes fomentarius]|nr:hypothetical protein C8Q74DRAFT_1374125 [Fomes fomentarius]